MDLDWAPDWAVAQSVEAIRRHGLAATLFVTNDTPALAHFRDDPGVELAVHPNYMPGSSHGGTPAEVMDHVLALVPDSKGVRAHGLWRSTSFVVDYGHRGLAYEASDLLFLHPGLQGGRYWNGVAQLPIWWEDDVQMLYGRTMTPDALPLDDAPPLAVLNFHPILLALNSADLDGYQALKAYCGERGISLAELTEDEVAPFVERERSGDADLLEAVCRWCAGRDGHGLFTLAHAAEQV